MQTWKDFLYKALIRSEKENHFRQSYQNFCVAENLPWLLPKQKPRLHFRRGFCLVGGIGLEPTTFAMSTQRSNQLS